MFHSHEQKDFNSNNIIIHKNDIINKIHLHNINNSLNSNLNTSELYSNVYSTKSSLLTTNSSFQPQLINKDNIEIIENSFTSLSPPPASASASESTSASASASTSVSAKVLTADNYFGTSLTATTTITPTTDSTATTTIRIINKNINNNINNNNNIKTETNIKIIPSLSSSSSASIFSNSSLDSDVCKFGSYLGSPEINTNINCNNNSIINDIFELNENNLNIALKLKNHLYSHQDKFQTFQQRQPQPQPQPQAQQQQQSQLQQSQFQRFETETVNVPFDILNNSNLKKSLSSLSLSSATTSNSLNSLSPPSIKTFNRHNHNNHNNHNNQYHNITQNQNQYQINTFELQNTNIAVDSKTINNTNNKFKYNNDTNYLNKNNNYNNCYNNNHNNSNILKSLVFADAAVANNNNNNKNINFNQLHTSNSISSLDTTTTNTSLNNCNNNRINKYNYFSSNSPTLQYQFNQIPSLSLSQSQSQSSNLNLIGTNPSFNLHRNSATITTAPTTTTTTDLLHQPHQHYPRGNMNHQQQQPMQHQTRPSSLVGNSFGLGGANITLNNNNNNNNNGTAASILSGSPLSQLSSQSHQLQLFQQQQQLQQQHKVQSPQQSVLSSSPPSGLLQSQHHLHNQHHQQQQQQLKRSMSSTSSPVPSPTSSGSQQHLLHHQQTEHHQQQQQQQQQQHHHHHHQQQHHQHHQQHHHYQHSMHSGGDPTYHFKILVPAVASGAIIGKGGETIASLQKDSGGRVKMSKSHDFYPGTNERVCLISGSSDAIMTVLDFIMDKIREKPDLSTKIIDTEAKQAQERDKQVKILVPNSTAGMIIGKAGAYIKQIKEESGSYVQISQKPKDITLQERCITIIGEKENNKSACKLILSKIIEDPQSGSCLNVSYADINGPVANYNPTGSPYATNQTSIGASNSTLNSSVSNAASAAGLLVNGSGINLSLNLSSPNPTPNIALATQLLEHIKVAMRGSGYSETVTNDVCNALGVLAKYGVLGVGVGVPQHQNGAHSGQVYNVGVSALEQSAAAATANSVFNAVGHVNLEQYIGQSTAAAAAAAARHSSLESVAAAAQYDPFRHGSQAATPISINNNSFGLAANAATAHQLSAAAHQTLGALSKSPTPGDLGAKDAKNVEVPDMIVGAILGPNGRTLVEIQHVSGANVQISKKGIFAPGTRNRIVTVTGQPNAIAMAQYLIEQKISEEEAKRARQNPIINNDEE